MAPRRPGIRALEKRIVFDAAAVATAAAAPADDHAAATLLQSLLQSNADSSASADIATPSLADQTLAAPTPVQTRSPTAIVFVDASVKDYRQFVEQAPPDALVVTLDPREDGVARIAEELGKHSEVQSVHIISHGAQGELHLGSTVLDADSLGQHAQAFAAWNEGLAEGADILLYGCDVGAGSAGMALVDGLASLTGADVAASSDPTGSLSLGGDWVLEQRSGVVESAVIAPSAFGGLLSVTPTFEYLRAGDGFLRNDVSGVFGYGSGEFVLAQGDGKVLVGGVDGAGVLIRHNADGSLDDTFGTGGVLQLPGASISGGVLQPDGKIVLVGSANQDLAVWRVNADGTLDTGFGTGGQVLIDFLGRDDYGTSVALGADGSIVVAGRAVDGSLFTYDIAVARLDASGALDTGFDGDGRVVTAISAASDVAEAVLIQSDGKIVVAGDTSGAGTRDIALLRYNTDGSLDTGFGTLGTGWVLTAPGQDDDVAEAIALDASGNIVLAGYTNRLGTSGIVAPDVLLARYTTQGLLDTAFGSDGTGLVIDALGARDDQARALAIGADGSITVTGISSDLFLSYQPVLLRYTAGGLRDNTFGPNLDGSVFSTFSGEFLPVSMTVDADGRFVVSGSVSNAGDRDIAVVRYLSDGTLDAAWGTFPVDSLAGNVTHYQGGAPVTIAPGVQLFDADMAALGDGGDYAGMSVTIARAGGAVVDDIIAMNPSLDGSFTLEGTVLRSGGLAFGTFIVQDGTLTVSFDSAETPATQALVDAVLSNIVYSTAAVLPPTGVTLAWAANDGVSATTRNSVVTIVPINDAPTFDANIAGGGVTLTDISSQGDGAQALLRLADGRYLVAGYAIGADGLEDFALLRFNADGTLDTTFGTNGATLVDFAADYDSAWSIALDAGGNILVAGETYNADGTYDFALARFLPDGTLDTTFGAAGRQNYDFDFDFDSAYALTVLPDGDILLAGDAWPVSTADTYTIALLRLNADGTPDTAFGVNGRVTTLVAQESSGYAVALDADGRIVVAGDSWNGSDYDFTVARYLADGTLDGTFGSGGVVVTDLAGFNDSAYALLIQPDGKIVAAGPSSGVNGYDVAMVRYNVDGSVDTGFGIGGIVTTDIAGGDDDAFSVALQGDKLILSGRAVVDNPGLFPGSVLTSQDLVVLRYNADGNLDGSFATAGVFRLNDLGLSTPVFDETGYSVTVDPDGAIVIAGKQTGTFLTGDDTLLVRLTPDGALDAAFGSRQGSTLGTAAEYRPFGAPVVLDTSVVLSDREALLRAPGSGDFAGFSVAISMESGSSPDDVLGLLSAGASFTADGGVLRAGGFAFGSFTQTGGSLTITFTSAETVATQALVNDVLSHVTYANTTLVEGDVVYVTWAVTDDLGSQNFAGMSVSVGAPAAGAWDGGAGTTNWSDAANWTYDTLPTATDDVFIQGATVSLSSGSYAVNTLTVVGGQVSIGGAALVVGDSITDVSIVDAGSQLLLSGGTLTLGGYLEVDGNYTQTGGTLDGSGTLTLTSSTNTWSGTNGRWTGGGTVVVADGASLSLSGSGAVGTVFGGRTLQIDAGATVNVAGSVELDPGTNAINNAGTLNLNSGDIRHTSSSQGSMTITNTGVINKDNANTFILGSTPAAEAVNLSNAGTFNLNAGMLDYVGGTGTSTGTFNVAAGATYQTSGTAAMIFAADSVFSSAGAILTSGGTATFAMTNATFTQTGSITTTGGTVTFTPDVSVPSITLSGGTTNFNGASTTPLFTQTGGTLGGSGTLTLTGATNTWSGTNGRWTGGGTVVVADGASLALSGTGLVGNVFGGRTLQIDAGATVNVAGSVELDPGTNAINNAGTLNLNSGDIRHTSSSQGSMTITNTGVINKDNANTFILGSTPAADAVNLSNAGTFNLNAGTLDYVGGTGLSTGSVTVAAGATWRTSGTTAMTFANGSTLAASGTLSTTSGSTAIDLATVSVAEVLLSGGTLTASGNLTVSGAYTQTGGVLGGGGTLTLTSSTNTWSGTNGIWTGGGTVVVANGADLQLTGAGAPGMVFAGRSLQIDAGGSVTIKGSVELDAGLNVIRNDGTLIMTMSAAGNAAVIGNAYNSFGTLLLQNNGTLVKSDPGFTANIGQNGATVTFENTGTVSVEAGGINFVTGPGSGGGLFDVAAGASLSLNGFWNLGSPDTFSGTGNVYFGVVNFASDAVSTESAPVVIPGAAGPFAVDPATASTIATANGSVSYDGTNFVYTPLAGFSGTDTFSYSVLDTNGSAAAVTVSVTVSASANQAPSFTITNNTPGLVVNSPGGPNEEDSPDAILLQPDGKILVAGYSYLGFEDDTLLMRYNADGSVDTSFGANGVVINDFSLNDDSANAIALQSDGKILLAGDIDGQFAVTRYNADGTLDTGFGAGGIVLTPTNTFSGATAMAIQTDGNIVVTGMVANGSNFDVVAIRYNADGSLDTNFGSGGIVTIDKTLSDRANALALLPDGSILIAGKTSDGMAVFKLTADGAIAGTFGNAGVAIAAAGTGSEAFGIAVQADGSIVIAGQSYSGSFADVAVARFTADGSPDGAFGSGGIAVTAFGGDYRANALSLQDDGKIVVAGSVFNGSSYDVAVLRFAADGTLDAGLDGDGVVSTAIGSGQDQGRDVVIDTDGRLVVVASVADLGLRPDVAVLRYNTDGTADTSFGVFTTNTLGGSVTVTAGGTPVPLDTSVQIVDPEMAALNGGLGNYTGASLVITREGGANAEDVFGVDTSAVGFTAANGELLAGGQRFGTYTIGAGTLTISFDSNATIATQALVNAVLSRITYANSNAAASGTVALAWSFSDGLSTGTGSMSVEVDGSPRFPGVVAGTGSISTAVGAGVDRGNAVIEHLDGKIVVVGNSRNGSFDDVALLRYSTDGMLDTTFGVDGKVIFGTVEQNERANVVVRQPDGKLIVAGLSGFDALLLRFNEDGTPDTSFGGGDGVVLPILASGSEAFSSLLLRDDGSIVAVGTHSTEFGSSIVVARFLADGSIDTSFGGGNGFILRNLEGSATVYSALLDASGRIVIAGSSRVEGGTVSALLRLNPDGTTDPEFSGGSTVYGGTGRWLAATQDDAGRIIVTGSQGSDIFTSRFTSDGALDPSFGVDGSAFTDLGFTEAGRAVTLTDDGKILVSGSSSSSAGDVFLVRYDSTGSLDSTFGAGGVRLLSSTVDGVNLAESSNAVVTLPDGRAVITGSSNNDVLLARFLVDGTPDVTLGESRAGVLDGAVTFSSTPVVLDADVEIFDPEMSALNDGLGDYAGASLVIARSGGASVSDVFGFAGGSYTASGGQLLAGGLRFGTYTLGAGTLTVNFDSNSTIATQALVNAVLSSITYANSDTSASGTIALAWSFSDGSSTGTGSTSITLQGEINLPPVAGNDAISVDEDATSPDLRSTLLANDNDPEGGALSVTAVTQGASGSVLLDDRGTADATDDIITYTADATVLDALGLGQSATDTFTYTVTDALGATSTATVTVTIRGVNDAPVTNGATAQVTEGAASREYAVVLAEGITWTEARAAALALGGGWDLATVTSAAENSLVISLLPASPLSRSHFYLGASLSPDSGAFEWVTGEPFVYTNWGSTQPSGGEDKLAYDFNGTWAWNDAPGDLSAYGFSRGYVIEREGAGASGTLTASDPDGDTLTFALVGEAPVGFSLDASGSWSFDASSGYEGLAAGETLTLRVAYTVTDSGGLSSGADLVLTVVGTDDPAVLAADAGSTTWGTPVVIDVLANDSDIDNPLAVTAVTQGANGSVQILADGTLRYTPTPGFTGSDSFSYTVADGSTQNVSINVARGDLVWTNATGDNNWSNPGNWDQGLVPTAIDTVVVPDALGAPQISGSATLLALHLSDTLTINGGTLTLTGASTIESTGNLILDGATLDGATVLQSSGTLTLRGGTVTLTLDNTGLLVAEGGGVVDQGSADFVNTGTIFVPPGQSLQILAGQFINRGEVKGHGTVDVAASLFLNEGAVSPGSSPGILTVSGNYTQTATGVLNIELGGPVAGTQYDQLIVSGTATLAGNLNLILLNGFVPGPNDGIQILSAGSIVGDFATVSGLPPGVTFSLTGGFGQGVTLPIPGTSILGTTPVGVVYLGVASIDPSVYSGPPEQSWIYQALAPPPEDYMVGDLEWQDMMEDIMATIAGEEVLLASVGYVPEAPEAAEGMRVDGPLPDPTLEAQLRAAAEQFTEEQQQILEQLRAAEEVLTCP